MIFVDSNIPIYLIGGAHPNRDLARQIFDRDFDLVPGIRRLPS